VLSIVSAGVVAGELHDATLRTFFLGFTFSMIFAHGPISFPAILERTLEFHPALYAPLALLHLGVATRFAGDLTDFAQPRPLGGLANALAILLFLLTMAASLATSRNRSG
jgi:nitrite reductase (NO-forming)